jgi:DNA-binding response OmpR family regulator
MRWRLDPEEMSIDQLIDELVGLRAFVDELAGAVPRIDELALSLGLTGRERAFFRYLALRPGRLCPRSAVYDGLYSLDVDGPDETILAVWACKVRKKLHHAGLEIRTHWGIGYSLEGNLGLVRGTVAAVPARGAAPAA